MLMFRIVGIIALVLARPLRSTPEETETYSYTDLYSDIYNDALGIVSAAAHWLASSLESKPAEAACPFAPDYHLSLYDSLRDFIRGQEEGIQTISNAIAAWEYHRQAQAVEELYEVRSKEEGDSVDQLYLPKSMSNALASSGQPLVLAITGPTGVGKSETAYRIGEAVFSRRVSPGEQSSSESPRKGKEGKSSDRRGNSVHGTTTSGYPSGLLVLRGEDFSPASEAAGAGIGEVHRRIKAQIADHLTQCEGRAVVVFDEIQKVVPGALEVLMPALEHRGSLTVTSYRPNIPSPDPLGGTAGSRSYVGAASATYLDSLSRTASSMFDQDSYIGSLFGSAQRGAKEEQVSRTAAGQSALKPVTRTISTANVIFLFISDIGSDSMIELLMRHENRSAIPQNVLRAKVKVALDAQWERLKFGKMVQEVVPYLPLEPVHIRQILATKLDRLARTHRHRFWLDLVVDPDLLHYLAEPEFVQYKKYTHKRQVRVASSSPDPTAANERADAMSDAATNNNNNNNNNNNINNNNRSSSSRSASTDGARGEAKEHSSGTGGGPQYRTVEDVKYFATWGGRSIENAGPLADLRSKIFRYMQPWRPGQILHVGLTREEESVLQRQHWGMHTHTPTPTHTSSFTPSTSSDEAHKRRFAGKDNNDYKHSDSSSSSSSTSSGERGHGGARKRYERLVYLQWCVPRESMYVQERETESDAAVEEALEEMLAAMRPEVLHALRRNGALEYEDEEEEEEVGDSRAKEAASAISEASSSSAQRKNDACAADELEMDEECDISAAGTRTQRAVDAEKRSISTQRCECPPGVLPPTDDGDASAAPNSEKRVQKGEGRYVEGIYSTGEAECSCSKVALRHPKAGPSPYEAASLRMAMHRSKSKHLLPFRHNHDRSLSLSVAPSDTLSYTPSLGHKQDVAVSNGGVSTSDSGRNGRNREKKEIRTVQGVDSSRVLQVNISSDLVYSDACETIWFGKLYAQ